MDDQGRERRIPVCSAYLPHDENSPTESIRKVVDYNRREDIHFIIGCDANSHHVMWGTDTNDKGEQLLEILLLQCRAVIGTEWGLQPEKVLWLYRFNVIPKITYAAVVWWKVTEGETLKKTFEHVQG